MAPQLGRLAAAVGDLERLVAAAAVAAARRELEGEALAADVERRLELAQALRALQRRGHLCVVRDPPVRRLAHPPDLVERHVVVLRVRLLTGPRLLLRRRRVVAVVVVVLGRRLGRVGRRARLPRPLGRRGRRVRRAVDDGHRRDGRPRDALELRALLRVQLDDLLRRDARELRELQDLQLLPGLLGHDLVRGVLVVVVAVVLLVLLVLLLLGALGRREPERRVLGGRAAAVVVQRRERHGRVALRAPERLEDVLDDAGDRDAVDGERQAAAVGRVQHARDLVALGPEQPAGADARGLGSRDPELAGGVEPEAPAVAVRAAEARVERGAEGLGALGDDAAAVAAAARARRVRPAEAPRVHARVPLQGRRAAHGDGVAAAARLAALRAVGLVLVAPLRVPPVDGLLALAQVRLLAQHHRAVALAS